MRSSTSVSQAKGSTPFSFAVATNPDILAELQSLRLGWKAELARFV